jgi:hypothetical protein
MRRDVFHVGVSARVCAHALTVVGDDQRGGSIPSHAGDGHAPRLRVDTVFYELRNRLLGIRLGLLEEQNGVLLIADLQRGHLYFDSGL